MRQSTRLILNTGITYVRMLITVGMGLLFTRLMVRGLGLEDFGLWSTVFIGVCIALMLTDGITNAADRYLAYEIGKGDQRRLSVTFSTLTGLFVGVATLVVAVGLPARPLALEWLNIEPEQLASASKAYGLTLAYVAALMLVCPFRSMLTAQQNLITLTLLELADAITRLAAVAIAMALPGDRLWNVCLMVLLAQVCNTGLAAGLCMRAYPAARPHPTLFSFADVRALAHYTTWSIVSTISYRVRLAGPPLIIARVFGVAATGGYALAAQLAGYQLSFGAAVSRISNPAMVAAEGRGDRPRVVFLINLVNKYSTLLMLFYLVPLQLETEPLLALWVGEYPPEAPAFVRLVMVIMALLWVFNGYWMAAGALNRITVPVCIGLACDLSFVGIGAALVKYAGLPALSIPAVGIATMLIFATGTVVYVSRVMHLAPSRWLRECWLPVALVGLPASAAAWVPHALLHPGPVRILAVGIVYTLASLPLCWFLAMGTEERGHFQRVFDALRARLRPGTGATPDAT